MTAETGIEEQCGTCRWWATPRLDAGKKRRYAKCLYSIGVSVPYWVREGDTVTREYPTPNCQCWETKEGDPK